MKNALYAFFITGCMFLAFAAFTAWSHWHFVENARQDEGTVIDLEHEQGEHGSTWYPVVRFKDNSGKIREFSATVGSSHYRDRVGEPIKVLYPESNPENAIINDAAGIYTTPIIMSLLGTFFACVGALPLGYFLVRRIEASRLLREGRPLKVDIVGVELNTEVEINGRNPWRIVCHWFDSAENKVHQFHSANLCFDPTPWIIKRNRTTVYVDRQNIQKYHLDISWLPEMA